MWFSNAMAAFPKIRSLMIISLKLLWEIVVRLEYKLLYYKGKTLFWTGRGDWNQAKVFT
jgi:hypothetical protein